MITVETQNHIKPLAAQWERLAQDTNASPFLRPGWVDAWWRTLGAGQLHILTAYENGQLVGVLPLRQLYGSLALIPNTYTRVSGTLSANYAAAKQLCHTLFSEKPRRVELDYVSSDDLGVSLLCKAAEDACYHVLNKPMSIAEETPYIAIEGTWDEFNSGLRRKLRSEIRRRHRRLEEEGKVTLEVSDGTESLDELLREGFRLEGSGWKDAYGTSVNLRPALRRFYTEVAYWAAEGGWLRLAFLRVNRRAVAFDYCFEHNNVHYLLRTGYDPAYGKFSPGMILRYLMLARAFSEGIAIYDFCGENWAWKREWTSTVQERKFLRMFAPTVLGSLDRTGFMYGRPALEHVTEFARAVLGKRGRHVLKRGRGLARRRFS